MLVGPAILSFAFLLIVILSSTVIKMIFKVQGCNGFGTGVCCAVCNGLIIIGLTIAFALILSFACVVDINPYNPYSYTTTTTVKLINWKYSITLWSFILSIFMSTYSMIYCFVRKIKDEPYSTALMFGCGNILFFSLPFLAFGIVGIMDGKLFSYYFAPNLLVVLDLFLLAFAVIEFCQILLVFLYLKQGSRLILLISLGCFFGPSVVNLIIFFNLTSYGLFYISIALYLITCGVSIFFYAKNYQSDVDTQIGESQLTPLS